MPRALLFTFLALGQGEKLIRRGVLQSQCFRASRFAARSPAQLDQLG